MAFFPSAGRGEAAFGRLLVLSPLIALVASLPPLIPDPRLGPSPWQVVGPDLAFSESPSGLLVKLPEVVDQDWLPYLLEVAAKGLPMVSVGVPEQRLVPYFDGVLVASPREVQELAACCPGTWVVAQARDAHQALERLAWGVRSLLVPAAAAWSQELGEAFPELQSARFGDTPLPTASRESDLALLVGLPPEFPGGVVRLPTSWVAEAGYLAGETSSQWPVHREQEIAFLELPPLPSGGAFGGGPTSATGGLEKVEVTQRRSLSLAEVLARHHRQAAKQAQFVRNFRAWQRLAVRVWVEELDRSFELELAGPVYFTPDVGRDWEVQEAWLDGVAWGVQDLPELPLIQPQAPKVPPLALELDPSYRYQLEGTTKEGGRELYVVSFSHQQEGGKRWGKAFIDGQSFGLSRLETLWEVREGEVRRSHMKTRNTPSQEAGVPLWLPQVVEADELVAAFGGLATVHRTLVLERLELNRPEVGELRQQAWARSGPMFRERAGMVVPLVPDGLGGRQEGSGKGRRQRFLLAGLRLDPSLDFPLPLAGYQLLDFHLRGQEQLRLFLAGAVNDLAWSRPGSWEVSARVFLQLLPFTSTRWVGEREDRGQELRSLRQRLRGGVARQLGPVRLALEAGFDKLHFGRTSHTAPGFRLPQATQELAAKASLLWQRRELLVGVEGEFGRRLAWRSWGFQEQPPRQFGRWGLFVRFEHAPIFLVKASLGGELWGSWSTDRFSSLSLGGFGGLDFPGFPQDRVRPEKAALLRAQVAFPLKQGRRLELALAQGWFQDRTTHIHGRPLLGGALSLFTRGPWKTLVQLQVGMPLVVPGPNQPLAQILWLRPF